MAEPLVSVIIVNYNGLQHLKECFESLKKTKYKNFETIFVDNGSTDQSVEFVEKNFKWVKIVKLDKNLGFAGGANVGVKHARGKYLAFLNTDVKLHPSWLMNMVKIMEKDPKIGVCTSKILLYKNPKFLNAAGLDIDIYGFILCRGLTARGYYEADKNQYKAGEVFSAHGASMLIRSDVLRKVGNFNPEYYMHYEDVDVCWRAKLAGYKVVYVPTSVVLHKIRGSTSHFSLNWKYYFERNRLRMLLQNYELLTLLKILPFYIFLKSSEMIFYTIFRKPKFSFQIATALFDCLMNLPKIIRERKFVQQKIRKIKDKELMKYMKPYSIELLLFLRGYWKAIL
jgi:GT2 family glycosyltransferase